MILYIEEPEYNDGTIILEDGHENDIIVVNSAEDKMSMDGQTLSEFKDTRYEIEKWTLIHCNDEGLYHLPIPVGPFDTKEDVEKFINDYKIT